MLHTVTVYHLEEEIQTPVQVQVPSLLVSVRDLQLALAAAWKPPKPATNAVVPSAATFLPADPRLEYTATQSKQPEPADSYPAEFEIFESQRSHEPKSELTLLPQHKMLDFRSPALDLDGGAEISYQVLFRWRPARTWLYNHKDGFQYTEYYSTRDSETLVSNRLLKCWQEGVHAVNIEIAINGFSMSSQESDS